METKNRYFLEGGRFYRQPPPVIVSGSEKVFETFAANSTKRLQGAFSVGDLPCSLAITGEKMVASFILNSLSMKTTFAVENGVMTPVFLPRSNTNAVFAEAVWYTPGNMQLTFAMEIHRLKPTFATKDVCLFARDVGFGGKPGFFRLPLPNHFEDGRLCLGDTLANLRGNTVAELCSKVLDLLKNSAWNSDQLPDMAKAKGMFRFSPADNTTVPTPHPWTQFCTSVSLPCMSEVYP